MNLNAKLTEFGIDSADHLLGASIPETLTNILEFVKRVLLENNMLPPKTDVLRMVDDFFDAYVGPKISGKLVRAMANELLLIAVGELYDKIAE
jgi:hypothetical protein